MKNRKDYMRTYYLKHQERIRLDQKKDYDLYRQAGFFRRKVGGKKKWVLAKRVRGVPKNEVD